MSKTSFQSGCLGKVVYPTAQAGYRILERKDDVVIYHCKHCGHFHSAQRRKKMPNNHELRRWRSRCV